MRNEIKEYWENEADLFDSHYANKDSLFSVCVGKFLNNRLHKIIQLVSDLRPNEELLDVGCGSGFYLEMAGKMGAKVVGVDYSEEMLELSRDRTKNIGAQLMKMDACNLGFADNRFNWVISIGLLDYIAAPEKSVSEMCRVLKPGGRIIFTIPKSPSLFAFLRTGPGVVIRRKLFGLPPIITVVSYEQLMKLLEQVGLKLEKLDSVYTTMWLLKCRKE